MTLRRISPGTVRDILAKAASARPDPVERGKWRVSGKDHSGRPIDVVVSLMHEPLAVLTVIRTDVKEDARRNPTKRSAAASLRKTNKKKYPSVFELAFMKLD